MFPLAIVYMFLVILFIHLTVSTLRTLHLKKKLPPGPWKLPIIGNLHQLSTSETYLSLRNLTKKHGPIMHLQLGKVPAIVISSKEIAEDVLKRVNFAQRPKLLAINNVKSDGMLAFFSPHNESWKEVRKIYVTELLSKSRVLSFKNARENGVWEFVESIFSASDKPVNFSKKIFDFTYSLNYRIIFGKTNEKEYPLTSLLKKNVALGERLILVNLFPTFLYFMRARRLQTEYLDSVEKLQAIIETLVHDRKAERRAKKIRSHSFGGGTIVDSLLEIQESGNEKGLMTDDHIGSFIMEIMGGASDTTATTLEWAMSELVRNPRVMAKAQAEVRQHLKGTKEIGQTDIEKLVYLKLVIKETLRFHPPAPLIARMSKEKCEIFGYEISEKTQMIVNVWALCRDPNYWVNPDEFEPERFQDCSMSVRGINFEFIPFGAGRRICPGITFATAILEVLLAQLLYHFDWKLARGEKAEEHGMIDIPSAIEKRKNSLYLIASPAH